MIVYVYAVERQQLSCHTFTKFVFSTIEQIISTVSVAFLFKHYLFIEDFTRLFSTR